ncbi:MAG: metalloregulator ArsR/SmtB family transcription factor [Planctomycetes bacterium]|jgi:DNA-binding transcriptional ArsR family regulator|nr:metalloregulator ArsR/SmtB family transcription factor [Planctomycetota bacterium]
MARSPVRTIPKFSRLIRDDEHFASIFNALGEPTRVRIMQILPCAAICQEMYNVVELAEELGLTQPTVSHHLKQLRLAGLVKWRRQCNSVYFYVNQPVVRAWLEEARRSFGCEARS